MPVSTRASSSDVGRKTLDVVWQTTILPRWDAGLRRRLLRKCFRRIEFVTVEFAGRILDEHHWQMLHMTLATVATHYHNYVAQLSPKAWLAANIATLMMLACDDLADAGNCRACAHQCLQCASHLRGLGPNATWNDISRLYNRGTFTNLNFELTPMNL